MTRREVGVLVKVSNASCYDMSTPTTPSRLRPAAQSGSAVVETGALLRRVIWRPLIIPTCCFPFFQNFGIRGLQEEVIMVQTRK